MASPRIEHVNVTVSDPDRAATLMEKMFGWQVRWQGPSMNGGRTVHVGSDDHYVALYAAKDGPAGDSGFAKGRPLNHIGVEVDDLDGDRGSGRRRRPGPLLARRLRARPALLLLRPRRDRI